MLRLIIDLLFAIFLPPIGVLLTKGVGKELIVSIILCLFFFLPGSLYAVYIVLKHHNVL